jgi:hypothetical protein
MAAGDQIDKAMGQAQSEKHRKPAVHGKEELKISWIEENAAAIAERRRWIEANGTPLTDLQVLKVEQASPDA